jgi:hypothetical protein
MAGRWFGILQKEYNQRGIAEAYPTVELTVPDELPASFRLLALSTAAVAPLRTAVHPRLPQLVTAASFGQGTSLVRIEWPSPKDAVALPPTWIDAARRFTQEQGHFDWKLNHDTNSDEDMYRINAVVPAGRRRYRVEPLYEACTTVVLGNERVVGATLGAIVAQALQVDYVGVQDPTPRS